MCDVKRKVGEKKKEKIFSVPTSVYTPAMLADERETRGMLLYENTFGREAQKY